MKKQKKTLITELLESNVETVSTNSLDKLIRIKVGEMWFIEDSDPNLIFGSGYKHRVKK